MCLCVSVSCECVLRERGVFYNSFSCLCVCSRFAEVFRIGELHRVLQVLGASSPQLEDKHRGLTDRSILSLLRGFAVRQGSTRTRAVTDQHTVGVKETNATLSLSTYMNA